MPGLTFLPNGLGTDNDGYLYCAIADISNGASSWSVALPFDVEITGAQVTQETAVTGADAEVTFEIGGTPITSMAVTVAIAGGAAGDAFTAVAPTGANSLAAGTSVEVITDGASSTSSLGRVAIMYKRVN